MAKIDLRPSDMSWLVDLLRDLLNTGTVSIGATGGLRLSKILIDMDRAPPAVWAKHPQVKKHKDSKKKK